MPNTRDNFFREHPDTRIGLPLHGPVTTTLEGELAQARSTIAQLDNETDTLRAEKEALRSDALRIVKAKDAEIERLHAQLNEQSDTIGAFQEWTGSILPQRTEHTDAPSYKTMQTRITRALDILHGIEPGE